MSTPGNNTSCSLLSLRILLFCALAATATTVFPFAMRPCAHSLSKAVLAVTGLDPYLLSCAATLPSDVGGKKKGGPIMTDVHSCSDPELPPHALPPFRCCPPKSASTEPVNFTFPDPGAPLRKRRAAHEYADGHVAKYKRAVALMKALPRSDPRSFYQQANVHCAYCTGAHRQAGHPELPLQIHFSWLFFPFHRAYLYFFERIAAKLLGDPSFALPFWSWDVPEGMRFPAEFADEASPLYDPIRDPGHASPAVVDLEYMLGVDLRKENYTDEQQIQHNFWTMYRQMVANAPLPSMFLGQPYRAGDAAMPGPGTVDMCPHNTVHSWTGDSARPNLENMGVYYSAGRDPVFYPHHANVDRLWEVWRHTVRSNHQRHVDFADPDWLDASFLFYDEEACLVRVTVRDMLYADRLRYAYDDVGLPWLSARPLSTPGVNRQKSRVASVRFPVSLDAAVTADVRRPAARRSRQEKQAREEVLVVEGIEADIGDFVKFEVYVNAMEYHKVPPGGREMAGTFVSLKHPGKEGEMMNTSMRVALNELLEDQGAEGDDSVTITLVPIRGKVKIRGLRILYIAE